jgi:hypothetical protein
VDWESRSMHARAEQDELRVALEQKAVTFHEVARSWFGVHDRGLSPDDREGYRALFPQLLEQFTNARHGIESDYFCEHIKVAAALTDIDQAAHSPAGVAKEAEPAASQSRLARWWQSRTGASASAIHLEPLLGEPEDVESRRLLSSCLDLQYRALEFLGPKHRKICMRRIFAIITSLLGTLDNRAHKRNGAEPVGLTEREARQLDSEFEDARCYYEDHAERRVQLRYLLGMGLGVGAAFALFVIVGEAGTEEPLMVSLFAGALGALISVLMRLTKGRLDVERETSTPVAVLLGLVRPLIGAVFGALVYVLVEGGLLTLGVQPPRGADPLLSYAGLGFLAGFSERIAQTAVSRGAGVLSDSPENGGDHRRPHRAGRRAARSGA